MVGHKVAIVSDKPQTTRRAIRGVVTAPDRYQLVLTDLPGVQRPRDALTARMQRRVESELSEADAALFVVNGEQGVGGAGRPLHRRGDRRRQRPGRDRRQQGRPAGPRKDGAGAAAREPSSACPTRRCSRSPPAPARASPRCSSISPACCPRARSTSRPRSSPTSRRSVMLAELVREQVLQPHAPGGPARRRGPGRRGRGAARAWSTSARCCGSRPSPRRAS